MTEQAEAVSDVQEQDVQKHKSEENVVSPEKESAGEEAHDGASGWGSSS